MYQHTHVVILCWLAAYAMAERAPGHVSPVCPLVAKDTCKFKSTDGNTDLFIVNERAVVITSYTGDRFYGSCLLADLDDPAFPRFPHNVTFKKVDLSHCVPPAIGYIAALKALNITVEDELHLRFIPEHVHISAASIAGLPLFLKVLSLRLRSGVMELQPNALAALDNLRTLDLWGVHVDRLPTFLTKLELRFTEIETLSLHDVHLTSLVVYEDQLESVSLTAFRLSAMYLRAPELVTLEVHDAQPEFLRDGLVDSYPKLKTLELRGILLYALPDKLLRGANTLLHFYFTHSNIYTIPQNMFSNNKKLILIDLSDNKLATLPRDVFSGLPNLIVLHLENNWLGAADLGALEPLKPFTTVLACDNRGSNACRDGTEIAGDSPLPPRRTSSQKVKQKS